MTKKHTCILREQFWSILEWKNTGSAPRISLFSEPKAKGSKIPKIYQNMIYHLQNFIYLTILGKRLLVGQKSNLSWNTAEMLLPITSLLLARASRRTAHLRLCALAETPLYTSQRSGWGTHSSPNGWHSRVEWNYDLYNLFVAAIQQFKLKYIHSANTRTGL